MALSLKRSLFLTVILLLAGCRQKEVPVEYQTFTGRTMGTYYSIKVKSSVEGLQPRIDSLLISFNQVFSTYDSTSVLSLFNADTSGQLCLSEHQRDFTRILKVSEKVNEQTQGYFDPTVMPLVRYWGFAAGRKQLTLVDSTLVAGLTEQIGWDKLRWETVENGELCLEKSKGSLELDFSAVAKGYAVDLVAGFLKDQGAVDIMVEIGGEVRAYGINPVGQPWAIGIDKPVAMDQLSNRQNYAIVALADKSIASSGNYRNFYLLDGKTIGHTIDPMTGYPRQNNLISVSVIADDCIYADALATGLMAMGYPNALKVGEEIEDADVLFLYLDEAESNIASYRTAGFEKYLLKIEE